MPVRLAALVLWMLAMTTQDTAADPPSGDPRAAALLAPLAEARLAPGAALAWREGAQTGHAVTGLRAAGRTAAIGRDDLWHIGSNTKSMTATLVARLAARGVLGWEDTVDGVLGDTMAVHPGHAETTYAELLDHRAGLPANPGLLTRWRMQGTDATRDAVADRRAIAARLLARAPREKGSYRYSNAGYILAGAMLEAQTGRDWRDLMREEVFAPLGMDSAGFGPPGTSGDTPDQPRGHRDGWLGLGLGGPRPVAPGPAADNIPALGPAGRVHLSAEDLLAYLAVHLREDPGFLPPGQWARLHRPAPGQDYVSGWQVQEDGRLVHNGSNTMWFAYMEIDPQSGRALAILANAAPIREIAPMMRRIAETFRSR